MRGKGIADDEARAAVGITPACAGKSEKKVPFLPPHQDHPRVCGEKARSICRPLCKMGSPPRMRGKVSVHSAFSPFVRITPACAGKSRRLSHCRSQFWDHPRVCGEKCSSVRSASHRRGSPPRVRGKVCDLTIIRVHHGITPAYAGKRLKRSHSIGHFSCILCLFHSVLHRASVSGGSRAGPRAPPCLPAQNTVPV